MDSILAILCIVFFAVLTYGLIQGYNLSKFHKYNCHTLYIPENLNLEQAFQSVNNLSLNMLKKRARILGASHEFINKYSKEDDKKFLKAYIIQKTLSDDHILFTDITEDITLRSNIDKREYCRKTIREGSPDINCPILATDISDYSSVVIPSPTNLLEHDPMFIEYGHMSPDEIIEYMKKEQDEYEDHTFSFMNTYE